MTALPTPAPPAPQHATRTRPGPAHLAHPASPFTGTGALLRLALRRDRVRLPAWVVLFVLLAWGSAAATVGLYPAMGDRVAAASAIDASPALLALYGPLYDPTSLGALAMWKPAGTGAVLLGLLALFTVLRHTRREEEAGRRELVGAMAVGRAAPLTAALLVGAGIAVLIGAASALVLPPTGLPLAGSLAFGAAWALCGIVFAAVGAVAAQLTRSARVATGLGLAALAAAFLLRAIGDAGGPSWLVWASPLGWMQQVRAFAGDRWTVLAALAALALVLVGLAFRLDARRDLDAGLFADRAGPAGSRTLRGSYSLTWRLQRGVLAAWTVGVVALGAVLGSAAANLGGLLDSPAIQQALRQLGGQQGLTDAFLAAELGFIGVLVAGYTVQAAAHLAAEEQAHRAEAVLAGPVGRLRWAGGHVLAAALGAAWLLLAAGAATGAGFAARGGSAVDVGRLAVAALAQLPAAWVVGALAVLLCGLGPRLAPGAWLLLTAFLLLGELGGLLQLAQWAIDLSPFAHVPRLPGPAPAIAPLLLLAVAALVLAAIGLLRLRRRDVE